MVSIPIRGGQTSNKLRLQPLIPTQYIGDTQLQPGDPWRLTCLDLSRDLVLGRLTCLSLLGDLPVQGSQEVKMPQPAQGPNSRETTSLDLPGGFDLQEDDLPLPAWGSAA